MAFNNQSPGYERKKMHKSNSHAKNDYKEQIRKKCYDRLKSQRRESYQNFHRTDFKEHNNQVIKNLISEELTKIRPNIDLYVDSPDLLIELTEEIEQEFNEWLASQANYHSEYIDYVNNRMLEESRLLCPVCKRDFLLETEQQQIINCSCGLQIDSDVFPLSYIKQRLDAVIAAHSQHCRAEPEFSAQQLQDLYTTTLHVKCKACHVNECIL